MANIEYYEKQFEAFSCSGNLVKANFYRLQAEKARKKVAGRLVRRVD